jgi:hypothetical protein
LPSSSSVPTLSRSLSPASTRKLVIFEKRSPRC